MGTYPYLRLSRPLEGHIVGLREEEKPRRKWGSVAETLGHANIKITLDIYSHVLPNMGDVVADTMDAALGL